MSALAQNRLEQILPAVDKPGAMRSGATYPGNDADQRQRVIAHHPWQGFSHQCLWKYGGEMCFGHFMTNWGDGVQEIVDCMHSRIGIVWLFYIPEHSG